MKLRMTGKRWAAVAGGVVAVLALAAFVWREDILRTYLDPKQPYQVYRPPAPPDYSKADSWAIEPLDPKRWTTANPPVDVFFVHPTTYDGGKDWNAPLDEAKSQRLLFRTMLPNYAGPFFRVARVFAPKYRQASLYSFLTLRDDAREARRFAYGDVKAAFERYLADYNGGRPFILAGVEQGGQLAARLLSEVVAPDPALVRRLAGAYLMETTVPAGSLPLPACTKRYEARCVVAWTDVRVGDDFAARQILDRALVWAPTGKLEPLAKRLPLCVNPLNGTADSELAASATNLGAANASNLEWGVRPAFLPKQVSAQCVGGLLRVSRPESPSFRSAGSWADRLKANPYNLFYADIEADARSRSAALLGLPDVDRPAPPLDRAIVVRGSPIHRID